MMRSAKKVGTPFVPLGIASLIVCFAVLCITVLSISVFASAKDELRDAETVAAAQKDFYEADRIAAEKIRKLKAAFEDGGDLQSAALSEETAYVNEEGKTLVAFGVAVDSMQTLTVLLSFEGEMTILSWQVLPTTEWTPEDSIKVWQGLTD